MPTDIIEVLKYTEDEQIVFKSPQDISRFKEILLDKGQDVILTYVQNGYEYGVNIKSDMGPKVTDGKVKLTSERKV